MIMFSLLRVSFYLSIIIILWVLFALFWGNIGKLINRWKESDIDIKIVSFFPPILFIVLLIAFDLYDPNDRGYMPLITMMIQLFAITLASAAAIIAFRNYRRKSGDELSYLYGYKKTYISSLLLYNEKDKLVTIFAVDVILNSGQRIRIIDRSNPIDSLHLSAFESKIIPLQKVFLYNEQLPDTFNFKGIKSLICITLNGPVEASYMRIPSLGDRYLEQKDILRARRVKNIPEDYNREEIDITAQYWIKVLERRWNEYQESYWYSHILTGYISNSVLLITDESLRYIEEVGHDKLQKHILQHIHKQKVNEDNYIDEDSSPAPYEPDYLVNGLLSEDNFSLLYDFEDNFPSFQLKKIERLVIDHR